MDTHEASPLCASPAGSAPEKPLLLLDIDGALSPYIEPGEAGADNLWWVTGLEGVAPQLPDWLANLSQHYEIVWATSWEDEANVLFGPRLGLEQLPVIHFTRGTNDENAKLSNVLEYVGSRPFAWVDDDLYDAAYDAAQRHVSPTLLIRTKRLVGLTPEHVKELLAFASSL
jgi:hypothetical protein